MPDTPLTVVIVTHDHAEFIDACLTAVVPQVEELGAEVIVVDNASSDDSAAVARRHRHVRVVASTTRRGFAANSNLGMAQGSGRYLLLLNPDTEPSAGSLAQLIDFMEGHPDAGICGAQLVHPDGRLQPSARRFPGLRTLIARRTPLRLLLRNSRWNRHHLMLDEPITAPQPVDWVLGACLMVRAQAIREVGPLDEGFELYVEDIDWSRRMRRAGWATYFVPTAQIVHHHQAVSDKRLIGRHSWLHLKGMLRYARKHFPPRLPLWTIRAEITDLWESATGDDQPSKEAMS